MKKNRALYATIVLLFAIICALVRYSLSNTYQGALFSINFGAIFTHCVGYALGVGVYTALVAVVAGWLVRRKQVNSLPLGGLGFAFAMLVFFLFVAIASATIN